MKRTTDYVRIHYKVSGNPKVKLPHSHPLSYEINGPNLSLALRKRVKRRTTGREILGGVQTVVVLV